MFKRGLRVFTMITVTAALIATTFTSSFALSSYTIKKGDSLYKIGVRYGVKVSDLKSANNLKSDLIMPGKVLAIPEKTPVATKDKLLSDIIKEKGITNAASNMKIVVDKSDHTITLYYGDVFLKTYHVELGEGGTGDKAISGDHKTPEGTFYIAQKSVLTPADYYLGTRWMRLSYPNIEDADRGLSSGLINQWTHDKIVNAINNKEIPPQETALGGGVGIHGGSITEFGKDWTWGCVGLSSKNVEDFYDFVKVGTQVIIQK